MKKIISEAIQVVIGYAILTIYSYYNDPKPENKYCWLTSAIIVIIVYPFIRLAIKKDKSAT